jgi:hypothetical protein
VEEGGSGAVDRRIGDGEGPVAALVYSRLIGFHEAHLNLRVLRGSKEELEALRDMTVEPAGR